LVFGAKEIMTSVAASPVRATKSKSLLRLGVVCDFKEENWPSMDLVSERLLEEFSITHSTTVSAGRICPPFRYRLTNGGRFTGDPSNVDRLLNRHWDYTRHLKKRLTDFDLFHISDHSYSNLLHSLPVGRVGVFCHDLDTFRCLLDPAREPRPFWFKAFTRRILTGFQKASIVFYSTETVRQQIMSYRIVDPKRLVYAPYGVSPAFNQVSTGKWPADLPHAVKRGPFLLHVGSCIPRKRIDVLLEVFGIVRRHYPAVNLVQVGGKWTAAQCKQIKDLGIGPSVFQLRRQDQSALSELYRKAEIVLMPSEAEGFGLPVVEALACGAVVVASSIPIFKEVGGNAVLYCPLDDTQVWAETIRSVLTGNHDLLPLSLRLEHARRFSWSTHANTIVEAYLTLL
jgi:glycosyltransferase involved in cell wall biosynthesis